MKMENQTDGQEAREKNQLRLVSGAFMGSYFLIYATLMPLAFAVTEDKYRKVFSFMLFLTALMISLPVYDFPLCSMTHKGIGRAKTLVYIGFACFAGGYSLITYFTGDWHWVFSVLVFFLPIFYRVWSIEELTT